jgi:hypothetical protein
MWFSMISSRMISFQKVMGAEEMDEMFETVEEMGIAFRFTVFHSQVVKVLET